MKLLLLRLHVTYQHLAKLCHWMQVALVAGSVYTCVETLAGVLFVITRDQNGNGYYPGNSMVTAVATPS